MNNEHYFLSNRKSTLSTVTSLVNIPKINNSLHIRPMESLTGKKQQTCRQFYNFLAPNSSSPCEATKADNLWRTYCSAQSLTQRSILETSKHTKQKYNNTNEINTEIFGEL